MSVSTIVATAGSTTANSYLTLVQAQQYADDRLQSTNWGTDATKQAQALMMATWRLDQLRYEGEKAASDQALKWPRIDALDDNDDEYDSDQVPALIKQATFETALWLLNQDTVSADALAPTGMEAFDRAKVGPLEVEPRHGQRAGALPDAVMRLLRPVLKDGGSGIMGELVRS